MIHNVIKTPSGLVLVFGENEEQMPYYQGSIEDVREQILKDAPPNARFFNIEYKLEGRQVPREEW